ncbi:archaeosortase A [Halomicroarcula sp. GCM10025324]|jgi:archaeosortase A (PGF-CTERM-specific)|uniref:archaeosortase A n=1 Tax=Haloarcula TaxID=2237 RepID=UPI0023E8344E|nr:archaeosortase A [Halomicroarcula sp. ZS-22-S1]
MTATVLQSTVELGGLSFDPLVLSEPLMWLVLAAFIGSSVLAYSNETWARRVAVAGWGLFALFWLVLIPHFVFTQKSLVEGLGSVAAVPLSAYTAYLLWNGRDSLFVLTRAVGLMGIIYVPAVTVDPIRQWLVELVTDQTAFLLGLVGVDPLVVDGLTHDGIRIATKKYPYESTFWFEHEEGPITYNILLACTGLGSIAIFAGGILAVKAPWGRKLKALVVTSAVIYVLNLVRNVFIAVSFGLQQMQWFVDPMMTLFGLTDPRMVSYYIADRILAQVGSVVVLVGITWLLVRELPEITVLVEDLLFLVTGTEYDLAGAFDRAGDAGEQAAAASDD